MRLILPRRINLNEWESQKRRLGLRCLYAYIDADGEPLLVLDRMTQTGERVYMEGETMETKTERKTSKLGAMLEKLYRQAAENPDKRARLDLKGGLRVELMVDADGEHRILLARRGAHPSPVEWRVTLSNLPQPPPTEVEADAFISTGVEPESFVFQDWGCLRGSWRVI